MVGVLGRRCMCVCVCDSHGQQVEVLASAVPQVLRAFATQ